MDLFPFRRRLVLSTFYNTIKINCITSTFGHLCFQQTTTLEHSRSLSCNSIFKHSTLIFRYQTLSYSIKLIHSAGIRVGSWGKTISNLVKRNSSQTGVILLSVGLKKLSAPLRTTLIHPFPHFFRQNAKFNIPIMHGQKSFINSIERLISFISDKSFYNGWKSKREK